MSEGEIRFGDVAETPVVRRLRPDKDPRWCVVSCFAPQENEPTIYVDLDTMHEIEAHAASDTKVELGGVLLGGQYVDEQGLPFVLVEDALRAERYEATKGSFKFTHETWEAISRRRDEYPEGVAMVGWYHTHPDWGVFLSGMDLFICRNFFARQLDLALVIDPCRDERGWFCWRTDSDRPEQTAGFYLYTSRFRFAEASAYARSLERAMPPTSTARTVPPAFGTSSPTVISVPSPPRNALGEILVVVILGLQTVMLAILLWQASTPNESAATPSPAASSATVDSATSSEKQVIERLLLEQANPATIAELLPKYQAEIDDLRTRVEGQLIATAGLAEQLQMARASVAQTERSLAESREENLRQRETLVRTQRELKESQEKLNAEQGKDGRFVWYRETSFLAAIGITAIVGLLGGAFIGARGRSANSQQTEADWPTRSEEHRNGGG